MSLDDFLAILVNRLPRAHLEEVLPLPLSGGAGFSPQTKAALLATIQGGRFPTRRMLSHLTQEEWWFYHDAVGAVVFRELDRIKNDTLCMSPSSSLDPESALFGATAAALYLHAGYIEAVGGFDFDGGMLFARSMLCLDLRTQITGLQFLEELGAIPPDRHHDDDAVFLAETRLLIVSVAVNALATFCESRKQFLPAYPGQKRYASAPILDRFLARLYQDARRIATIMEEIEASEASDRKVREGKPGG